MEKDKQTQKATNKTSFISAIASGASLNSISKPEIKKEDEPGIEEQTNDILKTEPQDEKTKIIEPKQELVKKSKNSKNHKEFIENILKLHEEKHEKTKEKTSLHTTPQLHYRLKLLAFSSNVNLLDLTNAILTSFLEENKEDIDVLVKKMSL